VTLTLHDEKRAKSQCYGKKWHLTERFAMLAAQASADLWNEPVFVYPCDFCKGWHLTTKVLPHGRGFPRPTNTAFPKGNA
jgi:hypothetical protein